MWTPVRAAYPQKGHSRDNAICRAHDVCYAWQRPGAAVRSQWRLDLALGVAFPVRGVRLRHDDVLRCSRSLETVTSQPFGVGVMPARLRVGMTRPHTDGRVLLYHRPEAT